MKHIAITSVLALSAGCTEQGFDPFGTNTGSSEAAAPIAAPAPDFAIGSGGLNPDRLDRTSDAQIASAASVGGGALLGQTVASLGDVTQAGLWLRTPLVTSEVPGRVSTQAGQSLAVRLIPIAGPETSGSQISLAAMRGLGLGLTDLPTLQVYRVAQAG